MLLLDYHVFVTSSVYKNKIEHGTLWKSDLPIYRYFHSLYQYTYRNSPSLSIMIDYRYIVPLWLLHENKKCLKLLVFTIVQYMAFILNFIYMMNWNDQPFTSWSKKVHSRPLNFYDQISGIIMTKPFHYKTMDLNLTQSFAVFNKLRLRMFISERG